MPDSHRESGDARRIESARAHLSLLATTVHDRHHASVTAEQECARADGCTYLVAAQRQGSETGQGSIDRELADGLHGIGVEGHARLAACRGDLGDGLHGADLVVGPHDGAQGDVIAEACPHHVGIDATEGVDGQPVNVTALLPEPCHGIEHGVVLDGRAEDAWAIRMRPGESLHREIIRLRAAGREDDLTRPHPEVIRDRLAGFLDDATRCATCRMQGRRIAHARCRVAPRLSRFREEGRGRRVIEIGAVKLHELSLPALSDQPLRLEISSVS